MHSLSFKLVIVSALIVGGASLEAPRRISRHVEHLDGLEKEIQFLRSQAAQYDQKKCSSYAICCLFLAAKYQELTCSLSEVKKLKEELIRSYCGLLLQESSAIYKSQISAFKDVFGQSVARISKELTRETNSPNQIHSEV